MPSSFVSSVDYCTNTRNKVINSRQVVKNKQIENNNKTSTRLRAKLVKKLESKLIVIDSLDNKTGSGKSKDLIYICSLEDLKNKDNKAERIFVTGKSNCGIEPFNL